MALSDEFLHLHPAFYLKTRHNKRKSDEQGAPVFDEIEMCEIRVAGDKGTIHHHRANAPYHLIRNGPGDMGQWLTPADIFPDEYKAFQENREQLRGGVPITEAPFLSAGEIETCKALNIFTVEALAGIEKTEKLGMGGDIWVEGAKSYLDDRSSRRDVSALEREVAELKAKLGVEADPPAQVEVPANPGDEVVTEDGPFEGMGKADLKMYIKERTGETPRGNPSIETLLEMCKEAAAEAVA